MVLEITDVVTFTNGITNSVRTQKFAKNQHFLPLGTHTSVRVLSFMVNSCVKRHFMG